MCATPILFESPVLALENVATERPRIVYERGGDRATLECDFVVGADGFHGVCRNAIPAQLLKVFTRDFPFSWLGILAQAAPALPDERFDRADSDV